MTETQYRMQLSQTRDTMKRQEILKCLWKMSLVSKDQSKDGSPAAKTLASLAK